MRVVLDTSTLIAAHISRAGVCSELMEDVLLRHELVISELILGELRRELRDKFSFAEPDIRAIDSFLRSASLTVTPTELPAESCRDPDDIPVLGTAVAGLTPFVITVDRDLLALGTFREIAILRPREFWERTTE